MASITIRNLSDQAKESLRMRAAKNGCSMEEEARRLLNQASNQLLNDSNDTVSNSNTNDASHPMPIHDMSDAINSAYKQLDTHTHFNAEISSVINVNSTDFTHNSSTDKAYLSTRNDLTTSNNYKQQIIVQSLQSKSILLIIGGGIAAYKSLDLIRRLRERGANVTIIMTQAAQKFITPLAAGALSASAVYTDLFSREDEQDVGHIRLARSADLIIVAPATADRLAKIAHGIADDLAGAVLLAATCPILLAPAMNPAMWNNQATKRNVTTLKQDGYNFIGPDVGEMAEKNEAGRGRMSEPLSIIAATEPILCPMQPLLAHKHIIVTSGPTHEPIDPVRYLANRSSGKQGHAIATALQKLGAKVTLISGPVTIPDPNHVHVIHVETACQMLEEVEKALPADAAIFVAAVADWRTKKIAKQKIKKQTGKQAMSFEMVENPDILSTIGHAPNRPKLVIGFAAETFDVLNNAQKKLAKKGADFIVANNVSTFKNSKGIEKSIMGGDNNTIDIIGHDYHEKFPEMSKQEAAIKIADLVAKNLLS